MGGPSGQQWHTYETAEEAERERERAAKAAQRLNEREAAQTWAMVIESFCTERAEECVPRAIDTLRGRLRRFFGAVLDQPAHLDAKGAAALYDALRPKVSVQEHRHALSLPRHVSLLRQLTHGQAADLARPSQAAAYRWPKLLRSSRHMGSLIYQQIAVNSRRRSHSLDYFCCQLDLSWTSIIAMTTNDSEGRTARIALTIAALLYVAACAAASLW